MTPEIARARSENVEEQIGIMHFDAHLDNLKSFGNDRLSRFGLLYRIAQIEKLRRRALFA